MMKKPLLVALAALMTMAVAVGCSGTPEKNDLERLVYVETFENTTFKEVGWRQSTLLGASTATWTVEDGKLVINNLKSETNPGPYDSYYVVLGEDVMSEVANCAEGFTVQYDVEYYGGGSGQRYIALPLFYDMDSGNHYFSFHYRICGYADFQLRSGSTWTTLDKDGSVYEGKEYLKSNARTYTDEDGVEHPYEDVICKRVFGLEYEDKNAMVSLNRKATVRIEYFPGEYLRVFMNDIYITATSGDYLREIEERIADGQVSIAIKAGSTIYGAVDNIAVAKGIGIPEGAFTQK